MSFLTRVKNYLWRPYEIFSHHPPEKIEKELAGWITKEPLFHLFPYYGVFVGNVKNGKFVISITPTPPIFFRGMGPVKMTLRGRIESEGQGSRIYGCLPGPSFVVWTLLFVSLGLYLFPFIYPVINWRDLRWETLQDQPFIFIPPAATLLMFFTFASDRSSYYERENKVLGLLRNVAG